jgi:hypothetical protein
MHHFLIGKPQTGNVVDHIDRDRFNNQRKNLRFVTFSENARNRKPKYEYRGVTQLRLERGGAICASARFGGTTVYLGRHSSKELAAIAYDNFVMSKTGDENLLNFKTIRQRKLALALNCRAK